MFRIRIDCGDQKKFDWFFSRRHIYMFFFVILLTIFIHFNDIHLPLILFSNKKEQLFEFNTSSYYNNPMPCVEPYCHIQCYSTYESHEIIRKESLTQIQQEHLMIDLGEDVVVKKLIDSIPPSKDCSSNGTLRFYPIVFGFIESYLPKTQSHQILIDNQIKTIEQICLPRKSKAFSSLIPGKRYTYKFNFENELDYRRVYSSAYFALTMKKAGWDCNRHYEILSSGTIPYFDRLDQASRYTLSLLPKSLLYDAQKLHGVNRADLSIDRSKFNIEQYYLLLHRLLYYAKHRLTTVKLAEYILKVINYSMISSTKHSVLFISHYESDYLKDFMLHGFTSIFKEDLHVFQPPRYLYDYPVYKMWTNRETERYYQHELYGMGYGYKLTLKDYIRLYERDRIESLNEMTFENNIRMRNYSLIVFGSILRENKFYSLVKQYYDQSKIVLIDGEDEGKDKRRKNFINWGMYFLREIPDDCRLIV